MIDYFLTNITISLIALIVLMLLKNSPARLRFYVVISSLFAWFTPWDLVSTINLFSESVSPFTDEVFSSLLWLEAEQPLYVTNTIESVVHANNSLLNNTGEYAYKLLTDGSLLFYASAIGLILFTKDIINYHYHLKGWINNSTEHNSLWQQHGFKSQNIPIRLLDECGPGMATGFIKPIIWLNSSYLSSTKTKTILTHELNHIKQHDPIWMWFLTFTQRLLWWNPLIRLLTNIAREQIELSCDEKCRQQLKENYSSDLAEILLSDAISQKKHLAAVTIKHGKNFNIKRIKKLTKHNKMKTKYLVVLSAAFGMCSFVGVAVNYQKPIVVQNLMPVKVESKRQKINIYRKNALHDELIDELLQITQQAKSDVHEILSQTLLDLNEWHVNRRRSPHNGIENSIRIKSFTMICYLLDKQDRYNEIPAAYDNIFPDTPIEEQLFLKHHVATAYLKMGLPEKALTLMADVIERQAKPKTGSLYLIAGAHFTAGNYDEVIATTNKLLTISNYKVVLVKALNLKRAAYIEMYDIDNVNIIDRTLAETYGVSAQAPKSVIWSTFPSPILQYLPEVS